MRLRDLSKRILQLEAEASAAPAAAHAITAEDLLLPVGSRSAPVAVGSMPLGLGVYQLAIVAEFNAPDQGDGSPPQLVIHLNGVTHEIQGSGLSEPIGLFQGNIGPTVVMVSGMMYVSDGGTLAVTAHVESSSVANANSPFPVTLDNLIVSLVG